MDLKRRWTGCFDREGKKIFAGDLVARVRSYHPFYTEYEVMRVIFWQSNNEMRWTLMKADGAQAHNIWHREEMFIVEPGTQLGKRIREFKATGVRT